MTQNPTTNAEATDLAAANGRACAEDRRPMQASNPYRAGSRNHAAFVRGYQTRANDCGGSA